METWIVMIAHNQKKDLCSSIEYIRKSYTMDELKLAVINNASEDKTDEWLAKQTDIVFITLEQYCVNSGKLINEAIKTFHIDGDVFFMLPGYKITAGCLQRMKAALYLQDDIGAVGPVIDTGNESSETAAVQTDSGYSKGNICQVIGLEEGAVLVRHDAVSIIGEMDESFYSFTYAVKDYLLRMAKEKLRLYIVTDAVVIGTDNMEQIDLTAQWEQEDWEKASSKWGMRYFETKSNKHLINMITQDKDAEITVLEIGCDCGATLLGIKNTFPNAKIYGFEMNQSAAQIASCIAEVEVGNVEEKNFTYDKNQFDYILFGDVLEHLHRPEEVIDYCREFLKEDGAIITSIPNLMNIAVIRELLEGYFTYQETGLLDRTHIHMFTLYEVVRMFADSNYEIENILMCNNPKSQEEEEYIDKIMSITYHDNRYLFTAFQFVVRARKKK